MKHSKTFTTVAAVILVMASIAFAGEAKDVNLKFKSKDVFVFKNGIGLVLKTGTVKDFSGNAVTDDVPDALMGSIITYVDDAKAEIKSVTAYKEKVEQENDVTTMDALLTENIGKKVKVTILQGEAISGTLKMASGDFIIVAQDKENAFIKKTDIKSLNVLEEIKVKSKSSKEESRIKFDIKSEKKAMNISLSYLMRGIKWIPLYKIDIKDSKKAKISLDAEIVNDSSDDITNANFYLIVGAPNFKFASEMNNPFSMKEVSDQTISMMARSNYPNYRNLSLSNTLQTQAFLPQYDTNFVPTTQPDELSGKIGTRNEDTFVYEVKNLNLPKGGRAIINLFEAEVDYEDVYVLELVDDFTSPEGRIRDWGRRNDGTPQEDNTARVWHNIRLSNSTSMPWTTGVATVFKNNAPISQDILKYTPSGIKSDVPLMIASDLLFQESGQETKRERGANKFYWWYSMDKVTVEANVTVTNAKDKEINLEVIKKFYGDEVTASKNGNIIHSALELHMVNPSIRIKWELKLKGKDTVKLDYGFTTWVRY